ncbi:MAG: rRNA maturation RNase YbeY [Cyanobacteria bacterium SIG26]|nr:rRNA maturation RNase YbeY [Cyanobacteria bacterium SIG26]
MINYNLYAENIYNSWKPNLDNIIDIAQKICEFYLSCPEIKSRCCIKDYNYNTLAFDFLFCDSKKTHEINKEYRNKDYPADIITFAVFADSTKEERFVLDFEINLGEIIIGLDKINEEANKKEISKETELIFMISHGILHLLGFDHQTEEEFDFVITYQKKALGNMGITYDKI